MSDFVPALFKGLYPVYLLFAIAGVIGRIKQRRWHGFDTVLLLSFCLFELSAVCQIPLFYGIWVTSKRYLWMGLPLCLPFAAAGVITVVNIPAFRQWRKRLLTAVAVSLIGINLFNAGSPIRHLHHSRTKKAERQLIRQTAQWIKSDWHSTSDDLPEVFQCDRYQSGKRPLVQAADSRIGWLCGGQNYPEFFAAHHILPDYIVSEVPLENSNYVEKVTPLPVHIYKRIK